MLIVDRVICDLCLGDMGQLHHQPAPQADLLADLRLAPAFTVCPDCWDSSEVSSPVLIEGGA
ncbi:hypothetical protein LPB260_24365 [Pseudomonas sp. LPB0260]|uniref:hypothetical protein n=1 Tax=Pseudomonas sp. LPB0260 TaxID=2614442 RepID=UPI0015C2051A|nr:hypothetical protein [Pseudomonas sp. LPB0260]QLC73845.1 hypothetical protein LPB260_09415 [Pseudomonas sp. LPB0260]QLC76619.1 hypothetical protein LPB260_24365 [Pseudomonas sp. LPB0260]